MKVKVKSLSRVRLFATPWIVAYQTPPSMGFFKQKTAYEMQSGDWSSDVCSSDLPPEPTAAPGHIPAHQMTEDLPPHASTCA